LVVYATLRYNTAVGLSRPVPYMWLIVLKIPSGTAVCVEELCILDSFTNSPILQKSVNNVEVDSTSVNNMCRKDKEGDYMIDDDDDCVDNNIVRRDDQMSDYNTSFVDRFDHDNGQDDPYDRAYKDHTRKTRADDDDDDDDDDD
jgi:hypothetical protein